MQTKNTLNFKDITLLTFLSNFGVRWFADFPGFKVAVSIKLTLLPLAAVI
jgi:hypothetical protein